MAQPPAQPPARTARAARHGRMRFAGTALAALAAALVAGGGVASARGVTSSPRVTSAASPAAGQSWPVAGQNISDTHDQPAETAISASNASQLVTKWTFTTDGYVSATPTVAGNDVYFPDWGGELWALTDTGKVIWSHSVAAYTGLTGDLSRTSPAIDGKELIFGDHNSGDTGPGAYLLAVSRATGALLWSVLVDSNPVSQITGSPTVYDGVVYVGVSSHEENLAKKSGYKCCTFRGAIVALNAATGQILWKAYTVPSNNGGGDSNLPGYYAGGAVWGSSPVVDPATGMLYVTTGNDYSVPPGVCMQPGQTGCTMPVTDDYFDSILGLDLSTGAVEWSYRTLMADATPGSCTTVCGPDYDFGSMPNLITTTDPATGATEELVGAGQKSGIYWAVSPTTGKLAWKTRVGPGGSGGGILWGSATDGTRIYTAECDSGATTYTLKGSGPFAGEKVTSGSWVAMDAATGKILWQTPDPQGAKDDSFVSTANGVVYVGSQADTGTNMYALDASTGAVLWSFASGGEVRSAPAIVGTKLYWGSGYLGGENNKFYAFGLPSAGRPSMLTAFFSAR